MNPSDINELLHQSRMSYERDPEGIHTFALYWITWEAYRTRLLAVSARLRGWRIEDAYFAIGAKRISSQKVFGKCFKALTDVELSNQTGLTARAWQNLNEIEVLRNRLVHGYKRTNPDLTHHASCFVKAILTRQEKVFGHLQLSDNGTATQIGDVLRQRPAAGRGIPIHRNREALLVCFRLAEDGQPKRLPAHSTISSWAKLVGELS